MVDINRQMFSFYGSIESAKEQQEANHSCEGDEIVSYTRTCEYTLPSNLDSGDKQNVTKQKRFFFGSILLVIFCTVSISLFVSSIRSNVVKAAKSKSNSSKSKQDGIIIDIIPGGIKITHENGSSSRQDAILPDEQDALLRDHRSVPPPFSTLDPVTNLNVYPYRRPKFSTPGMVFGEKLHKGQSETGIPLPTNNWYENMVLMSDEQIAPNDDNRIYTVPYVVSGDGPVAGIKLGSTRLLGMEKVVQITFVDNHGLTVGAAERFSMSNETSFGSTVQRRYTLSEDDSDYDDSNTDNYSPLTPLGLTLKWKPVTDDVSKHFQFMTSSIVRGMPYGTVHYKYETPNSDFGSILPTVVSQIALYSQPVTDSNIELVCSNSKQTDDIHLEQLVHKSVKIEFLESDITWLIFYSHPVYVRCYDMSADATKTPFVIQATRLAHITEGEEGCVFTSRIALMNNCTRGANPSHCDFGRPSNMTQYGALLHKHADVYPGRNTKIDYTFFSDEVENSGTYAYLQYDWDAHHVRRGKFTPENGMADAGLLMYSLPHHREILRSQSISLNSFQFEQGTTHCTPSLNGDACIVDGAAWVLKENLDNEPSFFAPRPPLASALHKLSEAINQDIKFRVPGYYVRGAGDTYFSGKILAKLSRILLITHELQEVCDSPKSGEYVEACQNAKLPSASEFNDALDNLRISTEVWINGNAETPFVYDDKWGGMCSCGCNFNGETQSCDNTYPDCPSFSDPGLDFGHAFYNDHHFHQGYHIYAAATVAYFDNDWGEKYFEHVLLLVRDIANPSSLDKFFPLYRMKDWYLGNSWASGIARGYPNGRNQESSSESIAAYEAISMYGEVMANIFGKNNDDGSQGKASVSRHVRDVGRLLTATELRSADRYWHVRQTGKKSGIYPPEYKPLVVGIMWNMMAQFQTWFGNAPHLAYGIQLLPLTPVSERRDAQDWVEQLYPSFAKSCNNAPDCREQGWGILQHAVLAELGHSDLAIEYAESLPREAYESAGGNGHSLTNTIWYYATRPKRTPITLPDVPVAVPSPIPALPSKEETAICPTCTKEQCEDGQCPVLDAPFLCTDGFNKGGCSMVPWNLKTVGGSNCNECCQLTYECQ